MRAAPQACLQARDGSQLLLRAITRHTNHRDCAVVCYTCSVLLAFVTLSSG